ncbi:MAG: hypothetical protein AABO58_00830 [Acidobacteriota bacterium]
MHRPPRLIADLLALAVARGEALADVAREIGVDYTTLMQYRSGRRRLSMQAYANILKAYGGERTIRDAALHYARAEYHPLAPGSVEALAADLPSFTVEALRLYVRRLPEEAVTTGRGLYLVSGDARMLSSAAQFLAASFEHARVAVCRVRADQRPSAADRRFALAAPVLLVERIDFACAAVADVLRERAGIVRPILVTSMQPPSDVADPHLRRTFAAMTRLIEISPPLPPPTHGPVLARAE